MKTKKKGNNWTAYHDGETGRYFAEIMYTSREGREQYDYEITEEIYNKLGTFADDTDNERLIKTAKMTYSFENTMYGTLGPERTVWDEEAVEAMRACEKKAEKKAEKKRGRKRIENAETRRDRPEREAGGYGIKTRGIDVSCR